LKQESRSQEPASEGRVKLTPRGGFGNQGQSADYFDEVGDGLAGVEIDPLAGGILIGQAAGLFALDPHEDNARQYRIGSGLGG